MPPVGFEPTISAGERPHTYALDRAATGAGNKLRNNLEKLRIGLCIPITISKQKTEGRISALGLFHIYLYLHVSFEVSKQLP